MASMETNSYSVKDVALSSLFSHGANSYPVKDAGLSSLFPRGTDACEAFS